MLTDPAIGTVALLPNQRTATLTAIEPYTRRDGAASAILTWTLTCATCGAPYTATTGREGPTSRNLKIKNCPAHRASRDEIVDRNRKIGEANRKRKATVKAKKAAEREAQKAARLASRAELAATKAANANPLGHPKRKLSDEDVAEIRKLSAEGFSSGDLAMVFPVSSSAIRNILGGRRRA